MQQFKPGVIHPLLQLCELSPFIQSMASAELEAQVQEIFGANCVWDEDLEVNILREPGPDSVRLLLDPVIRDYSNLCLNGASIATDCVRAVYTEQKCADNKSLALNDVTLLVGMLISNAGSIVEKDKSSAQHSQECTPNSTVLEEPLTAVDNDLLESLTTIPVCKKSRIGPSKNERSDIDMDTTLLAGNQHCDLETTLSKSVTVIASGKDKKEFPLLHPCELSNQHDHEAAAETLGIVEKEHIPEVEKYIDHRKQEYLKHSTVDGLKEAI